MTNEVQEKIAICHDNDIQSIESLGLLSQPVYLDITHNPVKNAQVLETISALQVLKI